MVPANAGTLAATQAGSVLDKQLDSEAYSASSPLVVHTQASQDTAPLLGSREQAEAYQQGSLLFTVTLPNGETAGYGGAHASAAAFTKAAAGPGAVLKTDQYGSYYQATDGSQYRL